MQMARKENASDPTPICSYCNKRVNSSSFYRSVDKTVNMHFKCRAYQAGETMTAKGYLKAGIDWPMIKYSGANSEYVPTVNSQGYIVDMIWAPEWAISFVKSSKRLNNEARHAALHMCALLNDDDKKQEFTGMVRIGGLVALNSILLLQDPKDICCKRGERYIKKLNKRNKKEENF